MSKENREENIVKEFNKAAGGYDDSRLVKSFQRCAQSLVISRIDLNNGMSILDLGCGTGQGTIDIARKLKVDGEVIGLDLSEKMIEQARQKLNKNHDTNISFKVGSASTLDYDNHFDCVFSTNAFHHFDDKEDIFSRVRKSLKQGGIFIVQDICDDYLLMKIVDFAGKIGEKAHAGSLSSKGLYKLFLSTGYNDVEVEKVRLSWFWKIMIGQGKKV